MDLRSDDWFFDAEIVLRAAQLRLKMGEIPTEFYKCGYRRSFINIMAVFEFIRNLLAAKISGIRR